MDNLEFVALIEAACSSIGFISDKIVELKKKQYEEDILTLIKLIIEQLEVHAKLLGTLSNGTLLLLQKYNEDNQ